MDKVAIIRERIKIAEAAGRLGVSERTVRELVLRGDIPAAKVGKCWTIGVAELQAFLNRQQGEQCRQSVKRRVARTGGERLSGAGLRSAARKSDGRYAQMIRRLRAADTSQTKSG
jgi:excisionase family DNA binding protein